MNPPSLPVLIAGAGPSGLVLAIELARRGIPLRIVEQRDSPLEASRGKGIQPRTLEVFDKMGLVSAVMAAGAPYPAQCIHTAAGETLRQDFERRPPSPSEPYGQPWMVVQWKTERVLRDHLATLGHRVEWGTRLESFQQDESCVKATLLSIAGGETVDASYLVGCDGGRSTVRSLLDIPFPGKTMGVRAVVADIRITGLDRDAWHRFNDGDMGRQLGLCPLMGTDLFQLQAPVPFDTDIDVSAAALGRMILERTGVVDIAVADVSWASVFEMNARLADRYRAERVFLVGDAAHVHPPTGGQGLNTSIQDAFNLGWKLAAVSAGAPDSLLDTYEHERRPIAVDVLGLSIRFLQAATKGEMRRGREAQQLDIGYVDSPLALEAPSRTAGLRAGARAPDASLTRASGEVVRLFDLVRGPHWTLLCLGGSDAPHARGDMHVHCIGRGCEFSELDGTFRDSYGARDGDWFLIRPDGYVGAILGGG